MRAILIHRVLVAAGVAVAVVAASSSARAEDLPLLPLGSVARPVPLDDDDTAKMRGCTDKPLPLLKDRLPFGPGELLSFDVALLGIRTGKVNLRVGERTVSDGVTAYALQAEARSDTFLEVLGDFDARVVSFFDPTTLLPVRMVNHVVAHQPFVTVPIDSREESAFAKGNINARVARTSKDGTVDKRAHLQSNADVVDLLSVVYYLRSRELVEGAAVCFELYHRRRLWHVEGTVGAIEVVNPPYGSKRGRRLDAIITRVGGKDPPPPRPVTAWIGDDADRLPLLVSTPDKLGNVEVRLLSLTRGRRLVAK